MESIHRRNINLVRTSRWKGNFFVIFKHPIYIFWLFSSNQLVSSCSILKVSMILLNMRLDKYIADEIYQSCNVREIYRMIDYVRSGMFGQDGFQKSFSWEVSFYYWVLENFTECPKTISLRLMIRVTMTYFGKIYRKNQK